MSIRRALVGLIFAARLFAALSSTVQWDVRTTGSDSNGGGFNGAGSGAGTDFSQQNAAQYTFSDLASTSGTTNPCVVTSASHNFVAADNRNIIHISAGTNWTTGWYEIVSTAANAATLDRACGSVASISGGTYFVGGALQTMDQANTNLVASNTVNVKSGTYTRTTTLALAVSTPATWIGFQTTHSDYGTAPVVTTATNSTDLISIGEGVTVGVTLDNFAFTNTAGTPAIGIVSVSNNSNYVAVRNCSFSGFTNAINGDNVGAHFEFLGLVIAATEIKNSTSDGINLTSSFATIESSWIHGNTGSGLRATSSANHFTVVQSILSNNGGSGIAASNSPVSIIDSVLASNTSDGLTATTSQVIFLSNTIIYGNGGFGVNGNVASVANSGRNNAYGSNTSGARNNFAAAQGDITLTANPFTSSTNFAPNNTAGGGAAVKSAGYPGAFPGGTTTGTINVGAVQTAGGGAVTTGAGIVQ